MQNTKRRLLIAAAALFMAGVLFAGFANALRAGENAPVVELPKEELVIKTQDGKEHSFQVEVAITAEEQRRGLMFREQMDEDAGMLFLFGREIPARFWMKNTYIPLDMLFIRADGTIANIHHNATPHSLEGVASAEPVLAVLELNGGISKKLGIQAEDKVVHNAFWEE